MVSIHIEPDEGYDHIYTNGNCVNGVARLYFDVATAIDSVSIKLEGFSRTTVRNTDGKPYTEHHRVGYYSHILFFPDNQRLTGYVYFDSSYTRHKRFCHHPSQVSRHSQSQQNIDSH